MFEQPWVTQSWSYSNGRLGSRVNNLADNMDHVRLVAIMVTRSVNDVSFRRLMDGNDEELLPK